MGSRTLRPQNLVTSCVYPNSHCYDVDPCSFFAGETICLIKGSSCLPHLLNTDHHPILVESCSDAGDLSVLTVLILYAVPYLLNTSGTDHHLILVVSCSAARDFSAVVPALKAAQATTSMVLILNNSCHQPMLCSGSGAQSCSGNQA